MDKNGRPSEIRTRSVSSCGILSSVCFANFTIGRINLQAKLYQRFFSLLTICTSYANNVKIYNLGLTSEERDKAYELIDLPETYDEFEWLFECFAQDHNYAYQVGFNGRSSGYLVLYQGGREPSDYKSRCTHCGQLNFRTVEETGTRCGKCGEDTRVNLTHPLYKIYTTGASIDQNEDFEDWSIEDIRDRVKLVQDFDRLCDNCLAALKNLINNTEIVDEEYTEVKTRKILKYKEV